MDMTIQTNFLRIFRTMLDGVSVSICCHDYRFAYRGEVLVTGDTEYKFLEPGVYMKLESDKGPTWGIIELSVFDFVCESLTEQEVALIEVSFAIRESLRNRKKRK